MYARTTTVDGEPSAMNAGIDQIRNAVMPVLQRCDGYIGLSLLVDRERGRCIATSAWQSEDDMHNSMQRIEPLRDQAANTLGGRPVVEEWEIAVLHREHQAGEGACVRVTWVKVEPDQVDHGIDIFKLGVLPALSELEGHCSASLLVDRASGRAVSSAAYDSFDAMQAASARLHALRTATSQEAGAQILDECDFELAIAHLRVPEMA